MNKSSAQKYADARRSAVLSLVDFWRPTLQDSFRQVVQLEWK